jgi:cysteinyl-tRNA synthetase
MRPPEFADPHHSEEKMMKNRSFALAFLLWLTAGFAVAQPAAQPDMANLFQKVNEVAQQLQTQPGRSGSQHPGQPRLGRERRQVLDEMLASVSAVHKSMAEDSEIWTELSALLELWEERRRDALQKSESNPAFLPVAQGWQTRLDTARELRNQISTERANSVALMRAIESDRDIVLAYYELGQADKAIESLQKVGANLTSLNENMQTIVKTADAARQSPIPQ